jgi:hypothetical protein
MSSSGKVTQINKDYLNNLKNRLSDLLTDVENQLKGVGASSAPGTTTYIQPVDQTLTVNAGGNTGVPFNAATALNKALGAMGGSVHDQLTWLHKTLTDMIGEITTTVNSFSGTESLNNESVAQLISDFQNTIGDFNNPPGGSGSTGSTGNTGSSGNSSPSSSGG